MGAACRTVLQAPMANLMAATVRERCLCLVRMCVCMRKRVCVADCPTGCSNCTASTCFSCSTGYYLPPACGGSCACLGMLPRFRTVSHIVLSLACDKSCSSCTRNATQCTSCASGYTGSASVLLPGTCAGAPAWLCLSANRCCCSV